MGQGTSKCPECPPCDGVALHHAAFFSMLSVVIGWIFAMLLRAKPPEAKKAKKKVARAAIKPEAKPIMRSSLPQKSVEEKLDYSGADPDKWSYSENIFSGSAVAFKHPKKEKVEGVITEGIETFKSDPGKYFVCLGGSHPGLAAPMLISSCDRALVWTGHSVSDEYARVRVVAALEPPSLRLVAMPSRALRLARVAGGQRTNKRCASHKHKHASCGGWQFDHSPAPPYWWQCVLVLIISGARRAWTVRLAPSRGDEGLQATELRPRGMDDDRDG
jgi:hypothetical protein